MTLHTKRYRYERPKLRLTLSLTLGSLFVYVFVSYGWVRSSDVVIFHRVWGYAVAVIHVDCCYIPILHLGDVRRHRRIG